MLREMNGGGQQGSEGDENYCRVVRNGRGGQGQSRPCATPLASDDILYENGPRAQDDKREY